jgi:hypothetical protein
MSQYNPISKTQQAERCFNRPVSLHVASACVIARPVPNVRRSVQLQDRSNQIPTLRQLR